MKEEIIKYFICPHQEKSKICREELVLDEVFDYFKSGGLNEIKEGYLKCKSCGSRFPIFFGIPVLVSNMTDFLRWNISHLKVLSQTHGQINKKMIEDAMLLLLKKTPKKEWSRLFHITPNTSSKMINGPKDCYFVNHYDSLLTLVGADHPLYGSVMKYCIMSPYSVLSEFLKSYLCINNSAMLEIGCHAGGA